MTESYWTKTMAQRISRRRALAISGGMALGGALLAACSGEDSGSRATSGLLTKPIDTSKQAKRGGTLKRSLPSDITSFDPATASSGVVSHYEPTYSRLFGRKIGYLEPSDNEIVGDIAESWEWTPDRLQLTAKLRPGVKFHNLPPVNGRALDMGDVLFSWNRFSSLSFARGNLVNAADPNAPVLSFTAPDSNTVVIKVKEPITYVQGYFSHRSWVVIMPKEAEDRARLDLRASIVGTGPFVLADYTPSVSLTYKRNTEHWIKDRPYVDQVDHPIVTEYASALSQFRAGNIHTYGVRQEDVLVTKRDVPTLDLYASDFQIQGLRMFFGWQYPVVRDKRVRQAWSMSIDRDAMIDAEFNTKTFEQAGLAVEKRWNTGLKADEAAMGWWLDPRGKDFGPNAKYYQYNIAEAKKLMAAAGYPDGPEMLHNAVVGGTGGYGPEYVKSVDIWETMAKEAGFRITRKDVNYATDFLPKIRDAQGVFAGHSYKSGPPSPTSDPVDRLTFEYSKMGGIGFHGMDAAGKGDGSGDPYIEEQLRKARSEVDDGKRRAIVSDLQRYLADAQYCISFPGGSTAYDLVWPALRNYRVFRGGDNQTNLVNVTSWWLDDTQPPLKKA